MALWLLLGALGVLTCWLMLDAGGYVQGYGALALVGALNVAPMLCLRTGQGYFLGRGELGKLARTYPEAAERLRIPASVEALDDRLGAAIVGG